MAVQLGLAINGAVWAASLIGVRELIVPSHTSFSAVSRPAILGVGFLPAGSGPEHTPATAV